MIKNGKWVADTTETKYGEVEAETGLDTIGQEASAQKERAIEVEKSVREEVGLATDHTPDTTTQEPDNVTEEPDKPTEEVAEETVDEELPEESADEPETEDEETVDTD